MTNFFTGLLVSDPGKERREKRQRERRELEELVVYLGEARPLVLTTEGREKMLERIQALLA